jgi:outer membrane protein assembly factor BamB
MINRTKLSLILGLGLLGLWAGCSSKQTPVEEISAPADAIDTGATTYDPPAEDWPWWRGPTRNGVAVADRAPVRFSSTENVIWQSEIPGSGHSSPTVAGNFVFLATANDAQQQLVMALDRETGSPLWSTVVSEGGLPGTNEMHNKSTHANCTVATNGEAVFVGFLHNDSITAYALDYAGTVLWEQKLGAFNAKFGYAPSPVIYQSLVIFSADNQGGGYLAAVDQQSGEIVWRKARSAVSTYSSPVVANVAGKDQLLISGGEQVMSYNPANGEEYWSCPGTAEATCGTCVWEGDFVFASGGYPQRETVCIDASTGQRVWSNTTKCYEQSLLAAEGYLYAIDDNGIAFCWEATTGKQQWKKRLGGPVSASPVLCGGNIYAANERGTFYVFKANPEKFELVAENQLGDSAFASPVICAGRLYLRVGQAGKDDLLYCFGEQ